MAIDWDAGPDVGSTLAAVTATATPEPAPPWPQEEQVEITSLEQAVDLLDRWITSHRRLEVALTKMAWDRDYYRDLARFTEAARVAEKFSGL